MYPNQFYLFMSTLSQTRLNSDVQVKPKELVIVLFMLLLWLFSIFRCILSTERPIFIFIDWWNNRIVARHFNFILSIPQVLNLFFKHSPWWAAVQPNTFESIANTKKCFYCPLQSRCTAKKATPLYNSKKFSEEEKNTSVYFSYPMYSKKFLFLPTISNRNKFPYNCSAHWRRKNNTFMCFPNCLLSYFAATNFFLFCWLLGGWILSWSGGNLEFPA